MFWDGSVCPTPAPLHGPDAHTSLPQRSLLSRYHTFDTGVQISGRTCSRLWNY
jgi:hypothetical protein